MRDRDSPVINLSKYSLTHWFSKFSNNQHLIVSRPWFSKYNLKSKNRPKTHRFYEVFERNRNQQFFDYYSEVFQKNWNRRFFNSGIFKIQNGKRRFLKNSNNRPAHVYTYKPNIDMDIRQVKRV